MKAMPGGAPHNAIHSDTQRAREGAMKHEFDKLNQAERNRAAHCARARDCCRTWSRRRSRSCAL